MLQGMATTTYYADDLDAARAWYTEFLGAEPYYTVPGGYFEFRVGPFQHELGVINRAYAPAGAHQPPGGGGVVFWHVDDLEATFARLLDLGATVYEPITPRGEGAGFVTAAVRDPFGNILGIMANPHFAAVAAGRAD
ncbi:VOC family protein [Nocardia thailandica]|uniref:VOC family protein n=1 Tax=Nocardia thailandica TaxID=257275 RepID=A0ABW6PHR5_9NOCA|nr:VOC family protein [Nocardia thailandica]